MSRRTKARSQSKSCQPGATQSVGTDCGVPDAAMREYRSHLVEARQKSQDDYDKTIVLLSGGALGLSLTFMTDVGGATGSDNVAVLLCGWGCLAFSIFLVLVSYYMSRETLSAEIRRIDAGESQSGTGRLRCVTESLNIGSGLSLLTGLVLVGKFAFQVMRG